MSRDRIDALIRVLSATMTRRSFSAGLAVALGLTTDGESRPRRTPARVGKPGSRCRRGIDCESLVCRGGRCRCRVRPDRVPRGLPRPAGRPRRLRPLRPRLRRPVRCVRRRGLPSLDDLHRADPADQLPERRVPVSKRHRGSRSLCSLDRLGAGAFPLPIDRRVRARHTAAVTSALTGSACARRSAPGWQRSCAWGTRARDTSRRSKFSPSPSRRSRPSMPVEHHHVAHRRTIDNTELVVLI